MAPKMPTDLDAEAKRKWKELIESVDPEVDTELLANYCRTYSGLIAIRSEKGRQVKSGKYETLVPGRDGALQLNPLQTAENRMVSSLNRMLRTLGLAPFRDEQRRRGPAPDPEAIDPLEAALCSPLHRELSAAEIEANRRRTVNEKLLAQGDWRKYEAEHDKGRPLRKD